MAEGKRGRPSKGDRTLLWARVPTKVAEAIKNEADQRGLAYGTVCAQILCAHFGEIYEPTQINENQETLELKTA